MNPQAQTLNNTLLAENPAIFSLLSEKGKHLFFPSQGIIAQAAEAKQYAHKYNATIGIATDGNDPLFLPSFHKHISTFSPKDIYPYAPTTGNKDLREIWRQHIQKHNPSLGSGVHISTPIVTAGVTHGISLIADLFINENDIIIAPDQLWENYRLNFETLHSASILTYPMFSGSGFSIAGLDTALREQQKQGAKKACVLLTFPNNPTGYTVTKEESAQIVKVIQTYAEAGMAIVAICDDAYASLFFEEDIATESLFAPLSQLHKNVLAVKVDGVTKEYFAWGFRVGFITYGNKDASSELLSALEQKTAGLIRATVSNISSLPQQIVAKEMQEPAVEKERQHNINILKQRAIKIKEILSASTYTNEFTPLPFNSGYFMLLKLLHVPAEALRQHLLHAHGIGVISTSETEIRIAFSSVPEEHLPDLFETIFQACHTLHT